MRQRVAEAKHSPLAGVGVQVNGAVQPVRCYTISLQDGHIAPEPSDCMQSLQQLFHPQHCGVVLCVGIVVKSVQVIALGVRPVMAQRDAVGVEARDHLGRELQPVIGIVFLCAAP